ncbi:MAG: hypothetical protein AB7O96_19495 [Pseudobdellovibrionaceae bacterium]
MKSIYAMIAILFPLAVNAANVKDFELNCHATGKVISVREAAYHKGAPPKGRFPGFPASAGFKGVVEIIDSVGCEKLKSKYDLNVDGFSLAASFSLLSPVQQPKLGLVAEATVGQIVKLDLKQYFSYQSGEGYLPLFPLVHDESMFFTGQLMSPDKIGATITLKPNLNWVYQIKPIENMSDIEKLSLAEKTSDLLAQKKFGNFLELFIKLEPQAVGLKKSYADLIWAILHEIKLSSPYNQQVLEFQVGGDGSSYGAPLVKKFNVISHIPGLYTSADILDFIMEFPSSILVGMDMDGTCLNFESADLETFLQQVQTKLPILTSSEKYLLKPAVMELSGKLYYGFCTEDKVSSAAKSLADQLIPQLSQH